MDELVFFKPSDNARLFRAWLGLSFCLDRQRNVLYVAHGLAQVLRELRDRIVLHYNLVHADLLSWGRNITPPHLKVFLGSMASGAAWADDDQQRQLPNHPVHGVAVGRWGHGVEAPAEPRTHSIWGSKSPGGIGNSPKSRKAVIEPSSATVGLLGIKCQLGLDSEKMRV
jgi:hypothetical protein